jgi:predicted dehydrogenase
MTTQQADGSKFAPKGKPAPVVKPGEFKFAAAHLDHGHIGGQCNGLTEAGGELKWVYDPDRAKVEEFVSLYPGVKPARTLDEILEDDEIQMVAAAAVPNLRGPIGCRVLEAGKDYFTDKCPFTTSAQLAEAKATAAKTGRRYMVYYSERLHTESGMYAGELIEQGAIGRVLQVIGLGPHRHGKPGSRPDWFYNKEQYGGILCDIGSHQCEQFLYYTGANDAEVTFARVENFNHPQHPEFEDFGEASLVGDNGTSFYYRVDWFTPDGLRAWGDGRTIIMGTDGFIEQRKNLEIASDKPGNQVYLVNGEGEKNFDVNGKIGFPFFGQLVLDCLNRTENAMTQERAFKAAELCLKCQEVADSGR